MPIIYKNRPQCKHRFRIAHLKYHMFVRRSARLAMPRPVCYTVYDYKEAYAHAKRSGIS